LARLGHFLQFSGQGNSIRSPAFHIYEHHDGEGEGDQEGEEPEGLEGWLAHIT
jgi:hypothetical protein